ncbi:MAG: DUF2723 domain-containing protein [Candidatus Eisenbacteria bacterium]|nr:DUF2723 domain-containing protein [Candidatus Eisenbacteria bacterium]
MIALAVGAAVFLVYLVTLCPTVYLGDSGELITAAATLGVAHPPGYPLYVLLGRLASFLPFGTVAFRLNLLSAIAAGAAASLFTLALRDLLARGRAPGGESALSRRAETVTAVLVALLFSFSLTAWSEGVKAEVYAPNLAALALLLFLSGRNVRPSAVFFLLGLAAANHQTILLLAPGLVYLYARRRAWSAASAARSAAALAGGLSLYLFLLARPDGPELFAWRKPNDIAAWIAHVTRAQYGDLSAHPRSLTLFAGQILFLIRLFLREMLPAAILLPFGAILAWRGGSREARATTIHFALFSLGLLLLLNHGVDARDGSIATVFYLPAILLGFAVAAPAVHRIALRIEEAAPRLSPALGLLLVPVLLWNIRSADARGFTLGADAGRAMLDACGPGAVLLTEGDNATFLLFYEQRIEGKREDVTLLDRDLNIGAGRFAPEGGAVTREVRDRAVEKLVASGRPVYSVTRFTRDPIAGKRLVSVGPLYRFLEEGETPAPTRLERFHKEGFDARRDYTARRFAVSYLSRWYDHYRTVGDGEGMAGVAARIAEAGRGLRETHLALGQGIAASGDTAAAVAELERSLAVDPDYAPARRDLADLLLAWGEHERACREYRLLAERAEGRAGDWLNLGNALLVDGRRDEAAEAYRDAMDAGDGDSTALVGAAAGYNRLGDHSGQAEALERLRRTRPGGFDRYEELGDALELSGRLEEALTVFREGAERDPTDASLAYKSGLALIRLGRPGEAEKELERAARADSALAGPANALAYLYVSQGRDPREALLWAERAVRHAGEREIGYAEDTRGLILARLGRTDEAERAFRRAVETTPHYDWMAVAEACDHLADLLATRGDREGERLARARADSVRGANR